MATYSARLYVKSLTPAKHWRIGMHKLEGNPLTMTVNLGTADFLNGQVTGFETEIGASPYLLRDLGKRNSKKARREALTDLHNHMLLEGLIPANTPMFTME